MTVCLGLSVADRCSWWRQGSCGDAQCQHLPLANVCVSGALHVLESIADADIWRKIGDGNFQSLARLIGGPSADAMVSEHPPSGSNGWYEQAKWPMVLDTPDVPAGTVLEYKIYVGSWGTATITIGSHRNGTRSSRCSSHLP